MIALLGESGSGKSTLEKMLCDSFHLNRIISYTTRPIRQNESNGIDYHYISDEEFEMIAKNNEFAEHLTFNNWHYGIHKKDCIDSSICVVTRKGLELLKKNSDLNIVSVHIKSDRGKRKDRLWDRGDCHLEMLRRLRSDDVDFEDIENKVDHTVENNMSVAIAYDMLVNLLKSLGLNR